MNIQKNKFVAPIGLEDTELVMTADELLNAVQHSKNTVLAACLNANNLAPTWAGVQTRRIRRDKFPEDQPQFLIRLTYSDLPQLILELGNIALLSCEMPPHSDELSVDDLAKRLQGGFGELIFLAKNKELPRYYVEEGTILFPFSFYSEWGNRRDRRKVFAACGIDGYGFE